jgi:hypothetical protein
MRSIVVLGLLSAAVALAGNPWVQCGNLTEPTMFNCSPIANQYCAQNGGCTMEQWDIYYDTCFSMMMNASGCTYPAANANIAVRSNPDTAVVRKQRYSPDKRRKP